MASDILHIKDGYFFEVPRVLWKSHCEKAKDFPSWFVRLDSDYQSWEADTIVAGMSAIGASTADLTSLKTSWEDWQHHGPKNAGWPLDAYLEKEAATAIAKAATWAVTNQPSATDKYQAYIATNPRPEIDWFIQLRKSPDALAKWNELKAKVNSDSFLQSYTSDQSWSKEK